MAFGILAVLALRNPVLVRLGVRNVGRRRARTSLIVLGLMLGTTIVAAALVTGDTMSHTIRTTATAALGETDEVVSAKGAVDDIPGDLGDASGVGWFPETVAGEIQSTLGPRPRGRRGQRGRRPHRGPGAPDAADRADASHCSRADPAGMDGFSPIVGSDGRDVSLADLSPGQAYLNTDAADELGVRAGRHRDRVSVRQPCRPAGAGRRRASTVPRPRTRRCSSHSSEAQRFFARYGQVLGVMISNRGSGADAVALSDSVDRKLQPTLRAHDLELQTIKQDAIEAADEAGSAFMAFFTTFGSFSIAAGILLIFLIFVMLAAERRGELGIARAVGTRRGHLVQMFTFEGAAYDVVAAVVGAILGAVVAFGMVFVMAQGVRRRGRGRRPPGRSSRSRGRACSIAFALGVLLTLVVVAFSAWRVSTMTIATAIRNLPEPPIVAPAPQDRPRRARRRARRPARPHRG